MSEGKLGSPKCQYRLHKSGKKSGCIPEFSVYTEAPNSAPIVLQLKLQLWLPQQICLCFVVDSRGGERKEVKERSLQLRSNLKVTVGSQNLKLCVGIQEWEYWIEVGRNLILAGMLCKHYREILSLLEMKTETYAVGKKMRVMVHNTKESKSLKKKKAKSCFQEEKKKKQTAQHINDKLLFL